MLIEWFRQISFPVKIRLLAKVCRRLQALPEGAKPTRRDIVLLALAWGNIGYAAGFSYLGHVGDRVTRTLGPILECGSGATTLLIAALTQRQEPEVIVLEHNKTWYDYLSRIIQGLGFHHVQLLYAPLINYGDYHWYDLGDQVLSLDISLVICDGPPGSTQGGRYGLMPVMDKQLAKHCVVLLDDTHRQAERRIIDVWRGYRCLRTNLLGRFGTHTEVIFC
jgi:hypothetical protein